MTRRHTARTVGCIGGADALMTIVTSDPAQAVVFSAEVDQVVHKRLSRARHVRGRAGDLAWFP